eukprot:XP_001707245.1 Hypothetical protein GL50803_36750 [Giardia lamblia ATCC 50803]
MGNSVELRCCCISIGSKCVCDHPVPDVQEGELALLQNAIQRIACWTKDARRI